MGEPAQISTVKRLIPLVFSVVITAACLFGAAGRADWWNAWVLVGLNFGASLAAMVMLWRNPELLAERRNVKAGKSWDKAIVPLVVLVGPVATWVTAGLDARFRWSEGMPAGTVAAGVIVALLASAWILWAMRVNRFFSAVVRIQKDRGHVVVSDGPYGFVRHPGYAGMCAFTLMTPLILNSRWAFVPGAATGAVTVLRTALEDRALRSELEGYEEYAGRVRWRLAPGVW